MSATPFDAEAIAILTKAADFAAKERELTALFAQLGVNESRELHQRLRVPMPDDALAIAFGRLVPDRRARVLAFVGNARGRAAIQLCPTFVLAETRAR
jgi:hypothetical protein